MLPKAGRRSRLPIRPEHRGFADFTSKLPHSSACLSNGFRSAQQSHWKEENCAEKLQHATDSDPHDAKWKQNQPDEWVGNECQQRQRPAQDKQNDPQQKGGHCSSSALGYVIASVEVPWTVYWLKPRRRAIEAGTSASITICESSTTECSTRPIDR